MPIRARSSPKSIWRTSTPSTRIAAGARIVEPGNQLEQRAFAGAGGADDRHALSGPDGKIDLLEHRPLGQIAERHLLEGDGPRRCVGRIGRSGLTTSTGASSTSKTRWAPVRLAWMLLVMFVICPIWLANS